MGLQFKDTITALNAVTATVANTAAPTIDGSKGQMKSIQFTCSSFTSGSGAYGVEVSNDGTNWVVYNRLITNATGTNSQTDAKTAAPTLSSATSSMCFFPIDDYFRYIRIFVTVTGTGTYSASISLAG